MEDTEDLEKRKEQLKINIKSFFNDKYNLYLIGILIFAFIIRIYYLIITQNQALWWDEAEYMLKAKSFFFDIPVTGIGSMREPIIPLIWAVLYLIKGELFIRFFQVIISSFTVFMTYFVGKQLFDKRTGLIASLFMSVLSLNLFFTNRILTYLWTPLIYLLIIAFFLSGMKGNKKNLYLSFLLMAIGLVAYFNTFFLILFIFIYLLFTERLNLIKEKKFFISFLIFILTLLPFFIYYYFTIGAILPRFGQFQVVSQGAISGNYLPFSQWFGYFTQIPRILGNPSYFGLPLLLFVFLGTLSLFEVILGFDVILKSKSEVLKNKLWLWLWTLVPLISLSIIEIVQNSLVFYDAFLLPIFPALAIISALGFSYSYDFIRYSGMVKKAIFSIIILLIIFSNLSYADIMIKGKVDSYNTLKDAGVWLKQNSNKNDKILTQAIPEITYYAERVSISPPREESNLSEVILKENPMYFVLTAWELAASPKWVIDYYQRNPGKLVPVIGFPAGSNPDTIIFLINSSAFEQE